MKKHLFIKKLLVLLVVLITCIPQMWANNTYTAVALAITSSELSSANANKVKYNAWDNDKHVWNGWATLASNLTFEGKKLYFYGGTYNFDGVQGMQWQLYNNDTHKGEKQPYDCWTSTSTFGGRIFQYSSTNAAAYSNQSMTTGARVYFDASTWDGTTIKLVTAHANHQKYYTMSLVTNTQLYYVTNGDTWSDAMGCGVVSGTYQTDGGHDAWLSDVENFTEYTGFKNYGLTATSANNAYLIVPGGKTGQQPTINYHGTHYNNNALNYTLTMKYAVSTNGATPVELVSPNYVPATITVSTYKFSNGKYTAVDGSSLANPLTKNGSRYNSTATAARTAATTFEVSSIDEDYTFLGWYTSVSGGSPLSTDETYTTYLPTSSVTIYARFSHENNHTVTISRYCTSTSSVISSTSQKVGEISYARISAPDIYGYEFVNWTLGDGLAINSGDSYTTSSNPIEVKTKDGYDGYYTLRANYTEVLNTDWKLIGDNQSGSPFGDNYAYASGKAMSKKSGASATDKAYKTIDVTKLPGSYYGFKVATAAGNSYSYGWGTSDGAYVTFNRSKSGSANDVYTGNQHELKFVPDGLGEYEFEIDYTATPCSVKVTFPTVYAVTFGKGGESGTSTVTAKYNSVSFSSGTKVQNGKEVEFSYSEATGYSFVGWNTANDGSGTDLGDDETYDHTVTSTNTVYAIFEVNNHDITRTSPTNGSLDIKVGDAAAVSTDTNSDYGKTITLTTTPSFGYYLSNLTVTKTGDASTVVSVTNNTFTMPDYDVTITTTYSLRYGLIGEAAAGGNHGMPGTDVASAADFTVSGLNLVNARDLEPNTTYLFKVYDRARTASRGYTTENTVLESGSSLQLSGTYDLKLNTAGRGEYTFKITAVTNNAEAYPTVTIDRPTSYELTLKHGNATDGDSYGGTVTATATESATEAAITDGQYVASGGSIAFTTTVPSGYTFRGWFSDDDYETEIEEGEDIDIDDDGEGTHTLTISSIGANVDVYAKYTGNTYTLSYDATTNGGNRVDLTKTVTMGRAYGETGTLPTAYRYGYTFLGWYTAPSDGTLVTDETIVTTASDHTIYAHFQEISYVYFYNNLGWENVYVTFNAYWDNDGRTPPSSNSNGSGNFGRPYHEMEEVDGCENVYRCQIPSYLTDEDWQYNICFNNIKQLSKDEDLPTTGDWNNFDNGQAVFRRDFDSYATMFVPNPVGGTFTKNSGKVTYYSCDQWVDHKDSDPSKEIIDYRYQRGYWRRFNPSNYSDTYAGYVIKGSWDGENHDYYFKRTAGLLGTDTFSVTVHLEKGQTYNFRIYKHCRTNNTYSSWLIQNSGNTITRSIVEADNYTLSMAIAKSETDKKDHIRATVAGEYTFKIACGRDGVLQLFVDYPQLASDGNWYRALYTWTDGSGTHTRVCKTFKRIDNSGTSWFEAFIHKSDAVTSRSLKLQKCTGITSNEPAWSDVAGGGITLSDEDITETGVYTFTVTRNKNQQPTGSFNAKYDGVYYIRTDATEGGWDYYSSFGGYTMDYSAYSLTQTLSDPYSHYYCQFVDNTTTSVAYTVATYNSPSICDTLKNTDGIVSNTYSFLPAQANVRFSYNEQTNALTRAYLKPATGSRNARYLVLHGKDTKVMDKDGNPIAKKGDGAEDMKANELLFSDEGDWIYSVTLKASPVAKASLIARYNGADRYLIGGAESYETILGGTDSETKYTIQATYNFKTNRLLMAWKPEGDNITEALANVDMLWVRHEQQAAKQISFTGSGALSTVKVVGALEFDFDELYGKVSSWDSYTRRYIKFFISLPFDVAISDIFGLHEAEYGEAYIVQKYNGAKRAKNGLYAQDENSFWETLPVDSVMHANEGYCLMMNNYYMHGTRGSIWNNKGSGSKVYLYLPSTGAISSISAGTQTITLPAHPCDIDRSFTPEGGSGKVSHKNTDANWNFMGVPLFSSYTGEATEGYPGAIFVTEDAGEGQGYLYKWDYSTNNYSVQAGTGFSFLPMHSYLVQFAGSVTFSGSRIPASVAARQRQEETNYNIDLQVLNIDDEMVNRTYVELRENACDTFLLNEDLYLVTNSQPINVFSFAGNYTVGANVLSVGNHIVPLGLIVQQNGTYKFSMPSNFSGTVTLIDTYAQTRTNLALDDYEVTLSNGTINDRFLLEININNAPTAIDGVEGGSLKDGKAHKFIMNDVLYILKDGVIYDARGSRVK